MEISLILRISFPLINACWGGGNLNRLKQPGILATTLAAIFALGILGYHADNAHAGSITVTINDNSADLNLVAAEGGIAYGESDTASFSVSTTSSGGYTTTIAGGNSDGRLTGTDSSNYFSPIATAITSPADFNNGTWGFKPSTYNSASNTSYQPVATSSNVATIDVTNSATTGNYTLSVAAKTDTNTAADTYSYNFVVAAITNSIDYDIVYTDASFPTRTIGSTTGSTVTLSNEVPTKTGYVFKGWCTASVALNASCTGTTYQPGATYTLDSGSNNDLTLYAIWAEPCAGQTYVMQNISSWKSSLTQGVSVTACDTRDESLYKVAKLADGNVWMQDNLALGSTTQTYRLTDADTHLASGATYDLPKSSNSTTSPAWANSYTASYINADYKDTISSDAKAQAGGWKIGVYYNYCAATADTICTDSTATEANFDICPKGWKMPSGGSSGNYQTLYNNSNYNSYDKYRDALHLPLSGRFRFGSPYNQGSDGYWWSTTANGGTDRYRLSVDTSDIFPAYLNDRSFGFTIRCISQ